MMSPITIFTYLVYIVDLQSYTIIRGFEIIVKWNIVQDNIQG